ncbi:TPA: lysis protein [Escherichia coli]|nr:lysis protein [Escherichia coli]
MFCHTTICSRQAAVVLGCQANYIRDVQGGTIAPSSSSKLTGIAVQ